MATYTMELWEVIDLTNDPGNGVTIGLGGYPRPTSWTDTDRDALNKKIIDHYLNREIGFETISIFEHRLMRKMNEIMPLYVQLYDSSKLQFDPLSTYDLATVRDDTSTENGTHTSSGTADGTTTAKSRGVSSTPPQGQLSGQGQYATGINDANSSGTSTSTTGGTDTTSGTNTLAGTSSTTGRQGSANRLLAEYRANILNIDLMVIEDLEELFLGVWDTNAEMLPGRINFV